ncbi:MAG TPA: septum formation initiator family protein [Solirubrobacteraceae bacterium]|nr:septum formation initiator family protein [Solirubrobacteraceae bacterium]
MASARRASAARATPRPGIAGRPRPRAIRGGAARATGIRWDRVGRVALLVVLVGILALYVGPAHSWWVTWHEARQHRAEVSRLEAQNARLRAHVNALRDPKSLEVEARKLGMIRPGERSYVIRGLPKGG